MKASQSSPVHGNSRSKASVKARNVGDKEYRAQFLWWFHTLCNRSRHQPRRLKVHCHSFVPVWFGVIQWRLESTFMSRKESERKCLGFNFLGKWLLRTHKQKLLSKSWSVWPMLISIGRLVLQASAHGITFKPINEYVRKSVYLWHISHDQHNVPTSNNKLPGTAEQYSRTSIVPKMSHAWPTDASMLASPPLTSNSTSPTAYDKPQILSISKALGLFNLSFHVKKILTRIDTLTWSASDRLHVDV